MNERFCRVGSAHQLHSTRREDSAHQLRSQQHCDPTISKAHRVVINRWAEPTLRDFCILRISIGEIDNQPQSDYSCSPHIHGKGFIKS